MEREKEGEIERKMGERKNSPFILLLFPFLNSNVSVHSSVCILFERLFISLMFSFFITSNDFICKLITINHLRSLIERDTGRMEFTNKFEC